MFISVNRFKDVRKYIQLFNIHKLFIGKLVNLPVLAGQEAGKFG